MESSQTVAATYEQQWNCKDKLTEVLKTVKETQVLQKTINEENSKLREENKKIYLHFTKEFLMLKQELKDLMKAVQFGKHIYDKLPDFPLNSHSSVIEFETKLRNDKEMQSQLIDKFTKTNNDNVCNFIKHNLKMVFKNDAVASKFSWTDANENISIKSFIIIQNLKDACLVNFPLSKVTKIEEVIKSYFTGVKDRYRKATKRTNLRKNTPKEPSETGDNNMNSDDTEIKFECIDY